MEIKLSIVIIAKDEEKMLPGCLKTAKWADEVLVVDTGSTDKTGQLAKKAGAKVISFTSGKNYSEWRDRGLVEARGEWIFYVDADERIPLSLKEEILKIINMNSEYKAYAVPRKNIVLGQELKHGGFWPDYQKRLFRKSSIKGWKGEVHEEPVLTGALGHLVHPLTHEKHETLSEMVDKTNMWSEVEAKLMFEAGHPRMNIPRFASVMFREFWFRMVQKQAFLDGKIGIIFALYQVFSRFTSYAKLWELQIKKL